MKLALMISGGLRGIAHAVPTWDWMLRQVDHVFYQCLPPNEGETRIEDLIPGATGVYAPDEPGVERYTVNGRPFQGPPFPGNVAGPAQARQIQRAFDLIPPEYDGVIRCRPDNYFFPNQPGVDFREMLKQAPLWFPRRFSWGGCCDRFCFGTREAMKVYVDFYDHINDWTGQEERTYDRPWIGNQESRIYRYLSGRVDFQRCGVELCKVLANGELRDYEPQNWGEF